MIRAARAGAAIALCVLTANCAKTSSTVDAKYGVSASPRVVESGEPVPKGGGRYRVGKPYVVAGRTYVPQENANYRAEGIASWYGDDFHGRKTANGEIFDMTSITAAHTTLPIPSYVRVTNLRNKRSLVVRVNDRGPYAHDRVIDLSARAAKLLDFHGHGLARVRVEYVGKAPLSGSDDMKLAATLRENGKPLNDRPTMIAVRKDVPPATEMPQTVVASANREFRREYFDATPMAATASRHDSVRAGSRYVLAGADAGAQAEPPARAAASPRSAAIQSARLEAPAPVRDDLAPRSLGTLTVSQSPASAHPVSAYAAPRYDGATGVMSGRGLY